MDPIGYETGRRKAEVSRVVGLLYSTSLRLEEAVAKSSFSQASANPRTPTAFHSVPSSPFP